MQLDMLKQIRVACDWIMKNFSVLIFNVAVGSVCAEAFVNSLILPQNLNGL
jgi:hypothetical protein